MPPSPPPESAAPGKALAELAPDRFAESAALEPANRSPRRRRNQICIAIIALGLINYVVYTVTYALLGGDARNGYRQVIQHAGGTTEVLYAVRGHHMRDLSGRETQVSRAVWIYSYLHSITVPLTSGALIISMLVLARPHILATMRGGWIGGQAFVLAFGVAVVLIALATTALFSWGLVADLARQ